MNINKLPPLGALKYFKVAAENLSFKLAAEQLYVSQAAISQHIKTLEEQLGCKLFVRKNREVALTAQGRILLPFVQKGFSELYKGVSQLEEDNHPNVLKLTVLPTFGTFWLIPRLHTFREKYPDLQVKMIPANEIIEFEDFNLDLAIRYGNGKYANLESRYLFTDEILLVGHPNVTGNAVNPVDLWQLPLLTENYYDSEEAWQDFIQRYALGDGVLAKAIEIRDATTALVAAVLAGQGVAMIRRSLIQDYLESRQLVSLFDYYYKCKDNYYLVAPEHHFAFPKVEAFERWLRNQLGNLFSLLEK